MGEPETSGGGGVATLTRSGDGGFGTNGFSSSVEHAWPMAAAPRRRKSPIQTRAPRCHPDTMKGALRPVTRRSRATHAHPASICVHDDPGASSGCHTRPAAVFAGRVPPAHQGVVGRGPGIRPPSCGGGARRRKAAARGGARRRRARRARRARRRPRRVGARHAVRAEVVARQLLPLRPAGHWARECPTSRRPPRARRRPRRRSCPTSRATSG